MKTENFVNLALLAGIGVAAFYVMKKLPAIAKKVNPASRDNVVYQSTGEIGLKIADIFKSAAEKKVDEMMKPLPQKMPVKTPPYIGPPPGLPVGGGSEVEPFLMGRWLS